MNEHALQHHYVWVSTMKLKYFPYSFAQELAESHYKVEVEKLELEKSSR
jgi:hypothetical protein